MQFLVIIVIIVSLSHLKSVFELLDTGIAKLSCLTNNYLQNCYSLVGFEMILCSSHCDIDI